MASRRQRELLPGLGSALSVNEAELLRQTAENLLLTRPGQEGLDEEATDRAAQILDMRGRLPTTHAASLHKSVAALARSVGGGTAQAARPSLTTQPQQDRRSSFATDPGVSQEASAALAQDDAQASERSIRTRLLSQDVTKAKVAGT